MVSNAGRKCAGNHTKFVEYCIKSNCPLPEDVVEHPPGYMGKMFVHNDD